MFKIIGHASENHESNTDSFMHLFEVWYSAVPLYIITTFLIIMLTYYLTKKSINAIFTILAFWLLASGVLLYEAAPVISVMGIVSGLFISAIFALAGLSKK